MLAASSVTYSAWGTTNKSSHIALSSGDRVATLSGLPDNTYASVRGANSLTGKVYFEVTFTPATYYPVGGNIGVGLGTLTDPASDAPITSTYYVGGTTDSTGFWDNGKVYYNDAAIATSTAPTGVWTTAFAYEASTRKLWIGNGAGGWIGGGNPATGTSPTKTMPSGTYYACMTASSNGQSASINCGQAAFVFTVPSGFSAGPLA